MYPSQLVTRILYSLVLGALASPLLADEPAPAPKTLDEAIAHCKTLLTRVEAIDDYTATLVWRDRIDNELTGYTHTFVKVRHKPQSVYLYFLAPDDRKGREIVTAENLHEGKVFVHDAPGTLRGRFGTVTLPDIPGGFRGRGAFERFYTMRHMTARSLEMLEKFKKEGTTTIKNYHGAKINKVPCSAMDFDHRGKAERILLRIFVHDALEVPIRFESYDATDATDKDHPPQLLEEYTLLSLKVNAGLTDLDFDVDNPQYGFARTKAAAAKNAASGKAPVPADKEAGEAKSAKPAPSSGSSTGCCRRGRRWRR